MRRLRLWYRRHRPKHPEYAPPYYGQPPPTVPRTRPPWWRRGLPEAWAKAIDVANIVIANTALATYYRPRLAALGLVYLTYMAYGRTFGPRKVTYPPVNEV